ncbi:hypothetical protein N7488_005015 [Penicillium malachiteum]|nr:hypothetical protein N7488_005015 [Penicillium malachiteum]
MNTNYSCQNRLFLLEDLEESKLETLGSALMIDPLVLADQLFTYHFSQTHTIPHRKLPSVIDAERSFTLRYYELRGTGHRTADAQTSRRRTFARASRQIESWKDLAEYQKETIVDLVRHNISFWCDEGLGRDKNQGAWNAILLVDPPINSQPVAGKQDGYYVLVKDGHKPWQPRIETSKPFRGGYSDLRPWQSSHTPTAPSRRSLFDDIIFYWLNAKKHDVESIFENCVNTTLFAQQIVASHWYELLDLQLKPLSNLDLTSKSKSGSAGQTLSTAEWREELNYYNKRLSLLGLLQRRLMWYKQEMLLSLERLGFTPGELPSSAVASSLRIMGRDFQAILHELDLRESRVDNLAGVVTDSINLSNALRSVQDARIGLQLSIVGAIFFPITLVAAIFSMGDDYAPGAKKFWLPWVVAIPLVLILILMMWQTRRPR